MERIQQYMNGEITTSTIANANGNWQFHEKPMTMLTGTKPTTNGHGLKSIT